ncbi:MAG: 4-(cytidine 5'-diphospho)-2-C-methyl-D-erythritol kinase [Dehalococcoidia bacterium]|jgi:4-diphosphocytidyl-2-C-methyl-D-erythritol kinase
MITAYAYAKVNITFEVLGRRRDGYHDITSVLQEIDLKDTLRFESSPSLVIDCDNADLSSPDNLALKAAKLLKKESGYKGGVKVTLKKGIPVAAGLGGGSSDAGAALVALNKLWKLKLSAESLVELAAVLGSDVPYFIRGGTVLAEGRGERIKPLPPLPESWIVLVRPSVQVPEMKTKTMYGALSSLHHSKGEHTKRAVASIERGVAGDGIQLYNAFDSVAFEVYEGMEWYWKQFMSAGAPEVHLAGAGPTLFTLLDDRGRAEALYRSLLDLGLETYIVKTISRSN